MFLIDGPYVSDYLKDTIYRCQIRVIKTDQSVKYLDDIKTNYISENKAVDYLRDNPEELLYTNSENTLSWIYENLKEGVLANRILRVKDKVLFRDRMASLHPEYFYKGIAYTELATLSTASIPFPVILKPAVGFFSLGVYKVTDANHWDRVVSHLSESISSITGLYPKGVLDNTNFIIEDVIPGEEFAVDCYYNDEGEVVIFNMMQHLFASGSDVSDRVYITSGDLMLQYLAPVKAYLDKLGSILELNNFPAHIELRVDSGGSMNAIEVNPLRFGGWCSTPDMAQYAWGVNIYEQLITRSTPDWESILKLQNGKVHALAVLDNSTGVHGEEIKSFNYEDLLKKISSPLELRKTNYNRYPLFGFLMCEVPENDLSELYWLLKSDLREFIELK